MEESITEADLLLTNVQAGTMLTDVALFIDSDNQALGKQAETKYWRHRWGGGWCAPQIALIKTCAVLALLSHAAFHGVDTAG